MAVVNVEVVAWPERGGGMQCGVRVGVKVTDIQTGISAAVDCRRRQYENKQMALELVKAMVSYRDRSAILECEAGCN